MYCVINLFIESVLFWLLVVLMCFFCFLIFFCKVVILCFILIILGVMLDIMVDMVLSLVFFCVSVVFKEKVICWNVVFLVVGFNILYLVWKLRIFVLVCCSFCLIILCLFFVNVSLDLVRLLLMLLINCFVFFMIVWFICSVNLGVKVWVCREIIDEVELMLILMWLR